MQEPLLSAVAALEEQTPLCVPAVPASPPTTTPATTPAIVSPAPAHRHEKAHAKHKGHGKHKK